MNYPYSVKLYSVDEISWLMRVMEISVHQMALECGVADLYIHSMFKHRTTADNRLIALACTTILKDLLLRRMWMYRPEDGMLIDLGSDNYILFGELTWRKEERKAANE